MRIINANYTKLFYGMAVSAVGDFVFDTTLILWISTRLLIGKNYAPAAVSGILVTVAIGVIVVGPVAGVFVDRWDKRRTMMTTDLVRAGLVALLGVVAALPAGTIPVGFSLTLIYVVVFLATAASQFFQPARFTLIGDIVTGDAERAKAAGLLQSVSYTAAIIGPPLAAPLLFQTGPYWALFINAASFVVSFLLIRAIRVAPAPEAAGSETVETVAVKAERRFFAEFRSGAAYVSRTAVVRAVMIAVTVVTLGAGAMNALMVFFVTDNLHSSPDWYGTIGMGEGLGAIAGTLTAAWISKRLSDVRVFYLGLLVVGVVTIVLARLDTLWQAVIVLALLGIPLGALNVALSPIVLRSVPRELLGRVTGIVGPVQYLAQMLAALIAGWLASTVLLGMNVHIGPFVFGRIDTIFTAAGVIVILGGLYAWGALRKSGAPATAPAATDEPVPVAQA